MAGYQKWQQITPVKVENLVKWDCCKIKKQDSFLVETKLAKKLLQGEQKILKNWVNDL